MNLACFAEVEGIIASYISIQPEPSAVGSRIRLPKLVLMF
jgi:hypothetical protein